MTIKNDKALNMVLVLQAWRDIDIRLVLNFRNFPADNYML